MSNYEIIKFVDGDFELDVNISPQQNTIWLTRDQIAKLFGKSRSTITEHINNIFSEGELFEMTSVGNSDITNHRPAKLYNLDVILAVGYRVKSKRGILFRRWATAVLRDYLIKGYSLSSDRAIVTKFINDNLKECLISFYDDPFLDKIDNYLIKKVDKNEFIKLINTLIKNGYEFLAYDDEYLFDEDEFKDINLAFKIKNY